MELAATGWSCIGAPTARWGEEHRSGRDPDTADSGKATTCRRTKRRWGAQYIGKEERKSDQEIGVETRKHRREGAAEGAAGPRLLSAGTIDRNEVDRLNQRSDSALINALESVSRRFQ
ncbi:hypothetical protein PR003_g10568 [Phytophthora rubi]|uniref:Uncharacterized protein n=1 Tax=Phytophthora rubi TaxID=129364 RepID=A0A6A3MVB0_9STRA|nr:hypothetical protein PR001_g10268 [Phytophthora rubi]KAE9340285.1 hypothetical protein PR003_g10568 [Phytophthora rubi]